MIYKNLFGHLQTLTFKEKQNIACFAIKYLATLWYSLKLALKKSFHAVRCPSLNCKAAYSDFKTINRDIISISQVHQIQLMSFYILFSLNFMTSGKITTWYQHGAITQSFRVRTLFCFSFRFSRVGGGTLEVIKRGFMPYW